MCKDRGAGGSCNIGGAGGAESQGQLSWVIPDARVHDVEPLQGFALSCGVVAKISLVRAKMEGGLGWGKLSRNLLRMVGSGGYRREGVQSHPGGTNRGTVWKVTPSVMMAEPWRMSRAIHTP